MIQSTSTQKKRMKNTENQLRKEKSINQIKINQLLKSVDRKTLHEHIEILIALN